MTLPYVRTYEYIQVHTYVREYTGSINSSSTRDVENGVVYRKLKKDGASEKGSLLPPTFTVS